MRRLLPLLTLALAAAPASAKWYGSKLHARPNAHYGCEAAVVIGALGTGLSPTNQTTCTYRSGGYFNRLGTGGVVPATGRIHRIRVRSGPHPAKLRLTILTGSARIDTTTGQDIPGTYTCCTARYIGKAFRPRANAITVKKVNVKVYVTRSLQLHNRTHASDIVALSAVSRGRLPLHLTNSIPSFDDGAPITIGFWPMTQKGDPRVDGYGLSGIELLFGWDWRRK